MSTRWEDLAARVRGLATHLLGRAQIDALARSADLAALADAFRALGLLVPDAASGGGGGGPEALDLAVRRTAAARLRTLARWAGPRTTTLAALYEDEDRRSLRAIIRGAAQGASAGERLAGLIPTPSLPERALAELARQPTPGAVAALLTAWGNPYGPALLPDAAATHPDLQRLEYTLNRVFAARALAGARQGGDAVLVDFVRETIDLENATTALVLAGLEREGAPPAAFVDGGRRLPLTAFVDAVSAGESGDAGHRLAAALARGGAGPLAAVLRRHAREPLALEDALLRARLAALEARVRRAPVGAAAVLAYVLRLRAEVLDLRRVIWGVALDAPRGDIARALVSAP